MATINIGSENSGDAFYRYKMPKPISKIEGRGNGIKTNVVNNVDIAKALERPPAYIIKFFGCELGAQTNFDTKNGTSIVNGAHDANTLLSLLEIFIKKYVQCYSCGNPETVMKVRKDTIFLKCKACGATSDVDMRHKLNNYILKNPPENKLSKEEKNLQKQEKEKMKALEKDKASGKKDKKKEKSNLKERKKSLKSDSAGEELSDKLASIELRDGEDSLEGSAMENNKDVDGEEEAEIEEDKVVWTTDVSAEAIRRRAQEQLTGAVAAMVTQGNIEAEAIAAKKKIKKILAKSEYPEANLELVVKIRGLLEISETKEIFKTLSDIKISIKMQTLYTAMFVESEEKLGAIVLRNCELLKKFAGDAKEQLAQLIGMEYAIGVIIPEKAKECAQVMKVLLDNGILDSDLIIAWYNRPGAGQQALGINQEAAQLVRENSKDFVDWLQEEDSEDDEDEDDSEEDEE